ncbi:MAG: DUF1553 domain-containing protein [Pirellulaceae bacterium]
MSTIAQRMLPALAALVVVLSQDAPADQPGAVRFERDIWPIFRTHCFDCHGAQSELKGGLDLRQVRLMIRGGDSGAALVPGKPAQSYLLDRIRAGEMPPGEKKVSPTELQTIERWIAAGAPTVRPEPESIGPGVGITEEERAFWSFQPICRPPLPTSPQGRNDWQSAVDAAVDWAPTNRQPRDDNLAAPDNQDGSSRADRRTLVVRAYFDLIGLPPPIEDVRRWCEDSGDDWFDRMLSELLASPHYGERWARHWLDVAGYADSEGYTTADAERSWAWKYRDWVIRALNEDRPFDQFLAEQLAGDELAQFAGGDLTERQIDLLTATGFLRMAADGTGSGADTPEARNQTVADTLKIIGTGLLGMSLQCAQCHDHRYDPIPQTDYYALRAVFEPALDWQSWKSPPARLVSLYTAADRQRASEVEAQAKVIADERARKQDEFMLQALEMELARYEEPLRSRLRAAYQTAGEQRSDEQKQLLKQHPSVNISPGVLYQYLPKAAEELKKYDERIAQTRAQRPAEEFLHALIEPANHVPQTRLFHRGDYQQPRQVIEPGGLTVAAPPGAPITFPTDDPQLPTTGRRLAFARWLVGGNNPLLARVIVNRVWMHHFGTGLVATPGDFGRLGAAPSHPELLDFLADEFRIRGWSLKQLHRVILSSAAWQARWSPRSPFRSALVRLEAETVRDRMLAVAGQLESRLGGPPVKIKDDDTGQVIVDGSQTRRTLYVQVRRSRPVGMLQTFDAPVMETNCECRPRSTVATQSLMLLNGEFILDQAARLADRAAREAEAKANASATASPSASARDAAAHAAIRAWQLAYCRDPSDDELNLAENFLRHQIETLPKVAGAIPAGRSPAQQALTNLCQSLLASNEFLYIE